MKKIIVITLVALLAGGVYLGAKTPKKVTDPTTSTSSTSRPKSNNKKTSSSSKPAVEAVDLGLSVKWASMNLGASTPEGWGGYYAWGETSQKSSYTKSGWKWNGLSYDDLKSRGIIDSKGRLTAKYDAASVAWGSKWRFPTQDEINELIKRCTWTWTTLGGHAGYRVTGRNGNSIFLPASGYRMDSSIPKHDKFGSYWTSDRNPYAPEAWYLKMDSYIYHVSGTSCSYGQSVRPVTER